MTRRRWGRFRKATQTPRLAGYVALWKEREPCLSTLFVAGRYSGTYNAVDVGITQDGYEMLHNTHAEDIRQTDLYGDSLIDSVHRGADVSLMFTGKAYKAGSLTPFYPWATRGVLSTTAAPLGRLASNVAMAMVLTSTANTPAAASPATLTASKALLPPGSSLRLLYTSRLRDVPIRLAVYPVDQGGGAVGWFTET